MSADVPNLAGQKSEYLAGLLQRRGIPHDVLNAKQHEREASIIERSGFAPFDDLDLKLSFEYFVGQYVRGGRKSGSDQYSDFVIALSFYYEF